MNQVGERAVARDTGGREGESPKTRTSATTREDHRVPGPSRSRDNGRLVNGTDSRATSKPGRPQIEMTALPPGEPATWYAPRGPNGPCRRCRARVLRRVERAEGAAIRVAHEERCTR